MKKAFSLMELLVVMSIIGMLSAVLIYARLMSHNLGFARVSDLVFLIMDLALAVCFFTVFGQYNKGFERCMKEWRGEYVAMYKDKDLF